MSPLEPGHVRMYVCGMTIYDLCHIGHARMMMAFDVVQRWLKASGYRVTYVRNITDIDDKIIKRAVERGITIRQLTDEMIAAMHRGHRRAGHRAPDHEPRATEYVPQMLALIGQLEGKGLAYRAANGDVNYAVRKFPGYGKLSGKSLDELRAGERVAVQDGKEDPLDFVLWKSPRPSEPEDAKWDSALGPGPPGLAHRVLGHELRLLGETFDIHGGGAGPAVPAPRERDRPERRRARQAASRVLDAQRLRARRQREDVQVAGQLLHHPRGAEASTTPRRCASSSCARTTAARSTTATCTWTTRASALAAVHRA
jgi:cysteinyl-tRNA synthetase